MQRESRAKIICTLGPATNTYDKICDLVKAGMDLARLNFSHGSHEGHRKIYETIRKISKDIDRPIGILQDLQGPKIRVKEFENGEILLEEGKNFIITVKDVVGNKDVVSVSYKNFHQDVKVGDPILLDDGELKLEVKKIDGEDVHCEVIFGGILKNHKGVNLPGSKLSLRAMTEKDKRDLRFGIELGVDWVALSFVQTPEDILEIKEEIEALGSDTPVIAKIEKPQAVENIDKIIDLADGIMIARGDLGVEMDPEEVPLIQKEIIKICNFKGIPVITATQMLDSMVETPRPTRAEASDVANAVLDGTDALMLSAETSVGKYPVKSTKMMDRIIFLTEQKGKQQKNMQHIEEKKVHTPSFAIGCSTYYATELVNADCIICVTQSGLTAQIISRFRPSKPIYAITPRTETLNRISLLWGVNSFFIEEIHHRNNIDSAIKNMFTMLKSKGMLQKGDTVVITAGLPFAEKRNTNMLRIEKVE